MSQDWVEKQLQQFKFDFDEADKDKSGNLSFEEVCNVLRARGFNGTDEEVKAIFKHLDWNANKAIDREEFQEAMRSLPKMSVVEFSLRKIFKALDKDGSGYLTRSEILDGTKTELVGMDISAERISDMAIALIKDDDGKLDYEEFLQVYRIETEAEVMRQVFTKLDADGSGYLTREEVYEAVKSDFELKLSMDKIIDLVTYLMKDQDKKISYKEFIQVWLDDKKKKCQK